MPQNSKKIYVLEIDSVFQPFKSNIRYPAYAKDFGVEQDFLRFINDKELITLDPELSELHYLPVFWTRYWINNDFGKSDTNNLREYLQLMNIDETKLFTVCQYDDGPLVDLNFGKGLYLSSRKTEENSDIPLLASGLPFSIKRHKRYLSSFIGRFDTHEIRKDISKVFNNRLDFYITQEAHSPREYAKILKSSVTCLAPRGYGGSSFRFYESMQSGVCPILIGDLDTRPFKSIIDWSQCSFFVGTAEEAFDIVDKTPLGKLIEMGQRAKEIYQLYLKLGKWPELLMEQLV